MKAFWTWYKYQIERRKVAISYLVLLTFVLISSIYIDNANLLLNSEPEDFTSPEVAVTDSETVLTFTPSQELEPIPNDEKSLELSPLETKNVTDSDPFTVPENLKRKVEFWMQIYGQYTSEYGVFHDAQEVDLIYSVVDFTPITRSKLHPFTKEHRIHALMEAERSKIKKFLKKLGRGRPPKEMTSNEQRIWDYFKQKKGKRKFQIAQENLRFQLGQKDFIEKAFYSSGIYLSQMEKIFLDKNLPLELTRIPFVESSFNIMARSRVGASGIWQIMPSTGKKLIPNLYVDYRNDPLKATEFAAQLLKFNYKVLKNWPLAVTAYNHGPTSLLKFKKQHKTDDLAEIIQKSYGKKAFGFASANFYTCFLAVLQIEKNIKEYFPDLKKGNPLAYTTVQLKKPLSFKRLARLFDNDIKTLEIFNPHITTNAKRLNKPIPKGTWLYFPTPESEVALLNSEKILSL